MKVNSTLSELNESKFISQVEAEEAIISNRSKYLVKGWSYTALMGLTTKNDLKNAAKELDECVELDSGNSHLLRYYKWVTVDHNRSTQLHVEFDSMLCK